MGGRTSWQLPRRGTRWRSVPRTVGGDVLVVATGVGTYFGVRGLTAGDAGAARENAHDILAVEKELGLDIEAGVQDLLVDVEGIATFANWIYIWGHWPVIAVTLLATLAATYVRAGGFGAARALAAGGSARAVRGATVAAGLALTAVLMGALTAKVAGAVTACQGFPACTRAFGTSVAIASAIAPEPVPRSTATGSGVGTWRSASIAICTTPSVSGRGTKTPGPTSSSMCRKPAVPTRCCSGSRRERRSTSSRKASSRTASKVASGNDERGTPSTCAASCSASARGLGRPASLSVVAAVRTASAAGSSTSASVD